MASEGERLTDFDELTEPTDDAVLYVVLDGKDHKLSIKNLGKLINNTSPSDEVKHEW